MKISDMTSQKFPAFT